MLRTLPSFLVLTFAATLIGCGKAEVPMHPVAGRVMFDGKPLHKGDIVFVPDADKGNPHLQFGMGKIGKDGSYVAQTFKKEGIQEGWYKVMVLATENEPEPHLGWVPIWIVPEKYTKPETTPISVEVVANPAPGSYDIIIER